jgi:hypothetical protein
VGERVLSTNEHGIWIREQKFLPDVGRPGRAPEHPEKQVEEPDVQWKAAAFARWHEP